MRLSLRTRVVLAMVLAGVVAVIVTMITVRTSVERGRTTDWTLPADAHADCEADPTRWHQEVADLVEAFAYDPTGRSANPEAPPLDPALLEGARATGSSAGDAPAPSPSSSPPPRCRCSWRPSTTSS